MEIIKKYKECNDYLNNLEVSNVNRTKSFIFGYLISLIIVFAPAIICAHFFIYSFYFDLIVGILLILLLVFVTLGEIFNDKLLIHFSSSNEKIDLKIIYIIHSILYFVILLLGYLIILLLH